MRAGELLLPLSDLLDGQTGLLCEIAGSDSASLQGRSNHVCLLLSGQLAFM